MAELHDSTPSPSDEAARSTAPAPENFRDLGFGSRVTQMHGQARFLNRDGTFNLERRGVSLIRSLNLYHFLISVGWRRFFALLMGCYLCINALFATGYWLCAPGALLIVGKTEPGHTWLEGFYFSVQTLSTIGYGSMSPHGNAANLLVTAETMLGLMCLAVATGLVFARFSRPVARIVFSEKALIAPYHGGTAFEFRIVNALRNQLVNLEARVILTRIELNNSDPNGPFFGVPRRGFIPLALERPSVTFFPLQWTVVHPIDEASPLFGMGPAELEAMDAEFIILLFGFDETFSQVVHARSSYKHFEIVHGARFKDMFEPLEDGRLSVDLRKLDDYVEQ